MIPKGAFYRYLNTGNRNLFLLRMGARMDADAAQDSRLKPDGSSLHSDTAENFHVDGLAIPGKTFGAREGARECRGTAAERIPIRPGH